MQTVTPKAPIKLPMIFRANDIKFVAKYAKIIPKNSKILISMIF